MGIPRSSIISLTYPRLDVFGRNYRSSVSFPCSSRKYFCGVLETCTRHQIEISQDIKPSWSVQVQCDALYPWPTRASPVRSWGNFSYPPLYGYDRTRCDDLICVQAVQPDGAFIAVGRLLVRWHSYDLLVGQITVDVFQEP